VVGSSNNDERLVSQRSLRVSETSEAKFNPLLLVVAENYIFTTKYPGANDIAETSGDIWI
jgi:hypothetical protein